MGSHHLVLVGDAAEPEVSGPFRRCRSRRPWRSEEPVGDLGELGRCLSKPGETLSKVRGEAALPPPDSRETGHSHRDPLPVPPDPTPATISFRAGVETQPPTRGASRQEL